jgi:hypothetical protein
MLSSTHSYSAEAVLVPPAGEADTMPPTLNNCSAQLLSNENTHSTSGGEVVPCPPRGGTGTSPPKLSDDEVVSCPPSGAVSTLPLSCYTSGVEAVSCPPSEGEDMLSSAHSYPVEALPVPHAALLFKCDSPWGSTEGIRLRLGDVVTAVSYAITAVVTSFPQDSDALMVRTLEGTSEFAPLRTPLCPAIFGRFSLHYALPAPVPSDTGASM